MPLPKINNRYGTIDGVNKFAKPSSPSKKENNMQDLDNCTKEFVCDCEDDCDDCCCSVIVFDIDPEWDLELSK